jgi:hypothetical protein
MKNLRQEKSLRDHEPHLRDLRQLWTAASLAEERQSANCPSCRGAVGSEWRRGGGEFAAGHIAVAFNENIGSPSPRPRELSLLR